ncbi:MAG: zinc-ribbon domain-containing protein [Oscillospiraceae bacterium]|nr:zinc-ribbon domain-containing protein [Oscillospiraceae bacterium]
MFCKKCGKQLSSDETFCTGCGSPVTGSPNTDNSFNNTINEFMDTPDSTSEFDRYDIEDNKIMAILSYIWILFLIPLLVAPQSRFARYHANQGLILFIFSCIGSVASMVFASFAYIGTVVSIAIGLFTLVLMVAGIVNAYNGKAKELPLIGKFKILN